MGIRQAKQEEADALGQLWLETTIISHAFLPETYWRQKLPTIKQQYLKVGRTFVYEENAVIKGFVTFLKPGFIGGLFVVTENQHKGIGRKLMEYVKKLYPALELDVYGKNHRALVFYAKAGFQPVFLRQGKETGEDSIRMRWERDN